MKLSPLSVRSSRLFTESLASITLTGKFLPTSRRKSRKLNRLIQSKLLTSRAACGPSKSRKLPQLVLLRVDVGGQRFAREQVALFALAAGIADHAGRAADDDDRPMAGLLKPPQDHHRHQIADVQAIGRRIEAGSRACGCRLSSQASKPGSVD